MQCHGNKEQQMAEALHCEMWHEEATNLPPHMMSVENAWLSNCHNIPLEDGITLLG